MGSGFVGFPFVTGDQSPHCGSVLHVSPVEVVVGVSVRVLTLLKRI